MPRFRCLCCGNNVRKRDIVPATPENAADLLRILVGVGWTLEALRAERARVEHQAPGLLAMLDSGAIAWPATPPVRH